jgi:peptidoglycan hydrolase CwlO-like protein
MSLESAAKAPTNGGGIHVSIATIVVIASALLNIATMGIALSSGYVSSRTKLETSQENMSARLTEIQNRLDAQNSTVNSLQSELAGINTSMDFIKQGLARLELSVSSTKR